MDGCTPTSICDDGGDGGGGDGCTTTEKLLVTVICGDADGEGCTPTKRWWWVWTLLEWLHGNMVV